jgi:hypothetical protein
MAQPPEDLSLGAGLIRKGEARGLSPALAVAPAAPVLAVAASATEPPAPEEDDPPLRAVPPDDIPKRFTSFRLPVALDEELRAMMYETRRSKQDLLIDFVTQGIKVWRRDRAKR